MSEEPIHAGILRVDLRLFEKLLQLPPHWRVRGIEVREWSRSLHLLIEAPEFPPVQEGQDLDRVGDVQGTVFMQHDYHDGHDWYRTEFSYVPRS